MTSSWLGDESPLEVGDVGRFMLLLINVSSLIRQLFILSEDTVMTNGLKFLEFRCQDTNKGSTVGGSLFRAKHGKHSIKQARPAFKLLLNLILGHYFHKLLNNEKCFAVDWPKKSLLSHEINQ